MLEVAELYERRTATDVVFDQLYEEIASLKLLPGTKLSEAEVAKRFGVSRQPIRDAFNRLDNLNLIVIRPQKATKVRGFSMQHIAHARFVRLAVELEVVRCACPIWDKASAEALEQNLVQQLKAVANDDPALLHDLDYRFHKVICDRGGSPMAFETIQECKRKVDRLCALSHTRKNELSAIYDDHQAMAKALNAGDSETAATATRHHLNRLDETIAEIHQSHPEYFE
ncbi:MAG: GntR family transcriptional regulator [Pseudomonadota bacterium]